MRLKILSGVLVLMAFIIAGCSHIPAGLAPSSSPLETSEVTVLGHATGAASYFSLFGVIPFGTPNYDVAISNAVSQVPGGSKLINVRSWFTSTYAIVGFVHTLHVEGDVVK